MSRFILCTVGTSLLTNRDERPWGGWRNDTPLPDAGNVDRWLKTADPALASAETNTLSRLDLNDRDILAFLHSDTPEGRFCAERLKAFYDGKVRDVQMEKIGKLGYGADKFTAGLKALVDIAIRKVREAEKIGANPLFCATGGFKAEIAFLNVMGALLGIEVVYIHEQHRELVRLPRLPLTWDEKIVMQHADFFEWIDDSEAPRKSAEVESWLRAAPELRTLVEGDNEGHTYLSAAGDLLYKAAKERLAMGPRVTWPSADPRPPREKNHVSAVEHHRPAGSQQLVERLCGIDCVTCVRYDPQALGAKVKVMDAEKGVIGVCCGGRNNPFPLRVETTARGEAQTEHVADYFRRLLK